MNLLEKLRQEITALRLSDLLVIARYIYVRTGELFEYDPFYNVADEQKSQEIREKTIDIRNVTDFHLVCYSWSKMYHELLNEFGIPSKIIHAFCHDYVEISIYNRKIVADMTKDYQDISLIKYGIMEHNNFYVGTQKRKQNEVNYADRILKYSSKMSMEEIVMMLRKELMEEHLDIAAYKEECADVTDYCYHAMKAIEQIMSVPRKNIGYISGKKFIKYLLINLLGKLCSYQIYEFFNRDDQTYIEVLLVEINGQTHYYNYQKMTDGCYELQEVTKSIVDFLFQSKSFEHMKSYSQVSQYHQKDSFDIHGRTA